MTLPTLAQDVLAPPAKAAIFLVVTVRTGAEDDIRDLLGDVAGLNRAVGFRNPEGELSCVVGIGADLWDRLFAEVTGGPAEHLTRAGARAEQLAGAGAPAEHLVGAAAVAAGPHAREVT